jgi:hypothetical protein
MMRIMSPNASRAWVVPSRIGKLKESKWYGRALYQSWTRARGSVGVGYCNREGPARFKNAGRERLEHLTVGMIRLG